MKPSEIWVIRVTALVLVVLNIALAIQGLTISQQLNDSLKYLLATDHVVLTSQGAILDLQDRVTSLEKAQK